MSQSRVEILLSLAFVVLAIWVFWISAALASGAGLFPQIAAALVGVSAAVTFTNRAFRPASDQPLPFAEVRWARLGITVVSFITALFLLKPLGFPIVSAALFIICATASEQRAPSTRSLGLNCLAGVLFVTLLIFVFVKILRVSLPMGALTF